MVIFVFVLLILGILILMSIYDLDYDSGFIDEEDEVHPKTEELKIYWKSKKTFLEEIQKKLKIERGRKSQESNKFYSNAMYIFIALRKNRLLKGWWKGENLRKM